jgi:hypothetical protein
MADMLEVYRMMQENQRNRELMDEEKRQFGLRNALAQSEESRRTRSASLEDALNKIKLDEFNRSTGAEKAAEAYAANPVPTSLDELNTSGPMTWDQQSGQFEVKGPTAVADDAPIINKLKAYRKMGRLDLAQAEGMKAADQFHKLGDNDAVARILTAATGVQAQVHPDKKGFITFGPEHDLLNIDTGEVRQGSKPPEKTDLNRTPFEVWYDTKLKSGTPPTAKEIQDFTTANTQLRIDNPAPMKPPNETGRMDKSYQFTMSQIATMEKPIRERADRLDRLVVSINQNTPQADSLIAPELLTAMAGGMGSGLRMNEAEISRIVGGRSNWESIRAAANKWQLDPSKALSITPAQREQIRKLISVMSAKVNAKLAAIDEAKQRIIDAPDVNSHRQIYAETSKKLSAADTTADAETLNKPATDPLGLYK